MHADLTGNYRRSCFFDIAWVYMSLSHAAARLQHLEGGDNTESAFYLSQSISAVNEAIARTIVSDSTIATVSCLTNLEVSVSRQKVTDP